MYAFHGVARHSVWESLGHLIVLKSQQYGAVPACRSGLLLVTAQPTAEHLGRGADGVEPGVLPHRAALPGRARLRRLRPRLHRLPVRRPGLHLLPRQGPLQRLRHRHRADIHPGPQGLCPAALLPHKHGEGFGSRMHD